MIWNRKLCAIAKPFIEIYRRVYPVKYARRIGVNIGEKPHFYGTSSWGYEPWIITLGDNVHITGGCKFIAHDGGTLIFRDNKTDCGW